MHPTPVLWPGKSHGWRSLVGYSPWGSLRVGHNWATSLSLFTFMQWRRKWQPTPVFLPGESQGETGGLPSVGSHRVRHDWSDLAAAAAGYLLKGKKVWFQIWNEPGQSSHFVYIKNLRLYMKTVITQSSPWIKKLKTNDCLLKNKKLTRQLLSYATHMLNIFTQNRKLLLQKYLKFIPHYLGYLTHVLRLTTSNGSSWKWFLSKLNHCLKMTG